MALIRLKPVPGPHYVSQGEHAVSGRPGDIFSAILGSCVAACLWDPVARIGGMNHFLLPEGERGESRFSSFGANAMEVLINALIKSGADRRRFRAKVFGGAALQTGLTTAGALNAAFILAYLEHEGIMIEAQSLGGTGARRVEFHIENGLARQKIVADHAVQEVPVRLETGSALELF